MLPLCLLVPVWYQICEERLSYIDYETLKPLDKELADARGLKEFLFVVSLTVLSIGH